MADIPAAEQLTRLGLTTYEAKAYVALIRRGHSTAPEVARLAHLPRQRIYDVLSSLVDCGLATTHPGAPARYAAVAPELAVSRLLAGHRRELADLEREAAGAVETLARTYREGQSHTEPLRYIEVLRDDTAVAERYRALQAAVKKELLVFTAPPYATPDHEGLQLLRDRIVKSVFELAVFDQPEQLDAVRGFVAAGVEARFVPDLPLKLVIMDESLVMVGLQDPQAGASELTSVVVEHPSLAGLLKLAFDAVWERGLTWDEARERFEHRAAPARG